MITPHPVTLIPLIDICQLSVQCEMVVWSDQNRFQLHPTKSKELRIDLSKQPRCFKPVQVEGRELEVVKTAKILGLVVSDDLK